MEHLKARKRIALISWVLVVASLIAIIIGIGKEGISVINLVTAIKGGLPRAEYAEYITSMAEGLVLIIHYFFVVKFYISVLKENVPLSYAVGHEMRVLGWETILLPIAVSIISCIAFSGIRTITEIFELEIFEMVLGVFIIQTGYVIDYAAGKIMEGHRHHLICNYVEEKYPEVFAEAQTNVDAELNK